MVYVSLVVKLSFRSVILSFLEMVDRTWQEILTELTTDLCETILLKIPKEDLINLCLKNKKLRESVDDYLKSITASGKDSAVALQKREEGNKYFLKNKYEECLRLYSESIMFANKNDEALPLAYANRAFVLQKLGYLRESLADIDMALATGYPKEKIQKLNLRKINCSEQLNKKESQQINKSNPSLPMNEYQLPKLSGGENKNFASASAYLSVYFNEEKGRHVIATKDIKIGEVLFVEKAFAFVVCEKACANCLKSVVAPVPCENCLDTIYCSVKCRDNSWKAFHSFQCGFGKLFNSVGIALLGLQVVIAASSSLDELKNKLNKISEPKYKNGPISFKNKGYESVYNLVHHKEKFEVNDLFQYTMTALLLATYMKNHTNYFPPESKDEDLKLLTSVILRHILQMICNGHAIMEAYIRNTKNSMVLDKSEHRIATGIYPSVSMMNHSCQPSVLIGFSDTYMVVQAAKNIKKGEEVFNCYGADARRMKRADRQEILSKQYFLNCKCQICIQPFDIQERFTALKCNGCKGPLVQKHPNEGVCIDCGLKSTVPIQLILKVDNFYSLFREGKYLLNSDVNASLTKFLKAWRLGREIFYAFHKDLGCAAYMIAECLAQLGDFRRCYSFLKCSVLSVEERFGFFSPELIKELNTLYDVQLAYIKSFPMEEIPDGVLKESVATHEKYHKIVTVLSGKPYFELKKPFTLEDLREAYA